MQSLLTNYKGTCGLASKLGDSCRAKYSSDYKSNKIRYVVYQNEVK